MRKVTENEKMVFEFIKDRIEEGYPPTVREICAEFGFKSTSTAHRYINNLTAKGLLEKGNNQNRAIRLTGGNGMKIPLVGTVTAGIPITAIEEQTPYAENGDIVCALVDNESATIKTFYKEDGHYRLQPENDTMDPIIVDEVSILGKVVGVVRYL